MKRTVVTNGLVAVLLLTVAGCTGDGSEGAGGESGTPGAESPRQADEGDVLEALGAAEVGFEQEARLDDGVRVVVGTPEEFEPSGTKVAGPEKEHVKFTVRVVNDSGSRIRPRDISVTVESDGGQGGDVTDLQSEVMGPPTGAIRPGQEVEWTHGFGVIDAEDVMVVVQVGLERAPVVVSDS